MGLDVPHAVHSREGKNHYFSFHRGRNTLIGLAANFEVEFKLKIKLGMMVDACNPSTEDMEIGRSGVQGQPEPGLSRTLS